MKVQKRPGSKSGSKAEWMETTYGSAVAKHKERKDRFSTLSDMPVAPLYTREDAPSAEDLGFPGEFPYTRGIQASMYRGRLWTMRQFAGFGSPEDTNKRFHYLTEHGVTGLSTAFDMPALMGRDADDPLSRGEVGREGVAVSTLADMEILFDRIAMDQVTTSMTINGPASIVWAMYLAAAEKKGIPLSALGGTTQNDCLKEYIAQREWIVPVKPAMELVVDTLRFGARETPRWNPISVSGYHIREAGSTAVQELAFTLADGFSYVELGRDRGLDVDRFAQGLSFFFNSHIDFFEEIAKVRAARRSWARWMRDRYGAKDPDSWRLRFHTQTAGCSLTAEQPENNIVRTAIEALAAVLGGTQSLHTNALDEVLALPTEKAAQIALRTQQVIAHETGVANTIDPLGGSYFVEALTNKTEGLAEEYFSRIEEMGRGSILEGMLVGIERGWFQSEIADAAFREQERFEKGRLVRVGVNEFVNPDEPPLDILKIGPEIEEEQIDSVQRMRKGRDDQIVKKTLGRLQDAARDESENLMPPLIDCARAYCTEGEITDALRQVFGEYLETPRF